MDFPVVYSFFTRHLCMSASASPRPFTRPFIRPSFDVRCAAVYQDFIVFTSMIETTKLFDIS